jgi:hypothetical protein
MSIDVKPTRVNSAISCGAYNGLSAAAGGPPMPAKLQESRDA